MHSSNLRPAIKKFAGVLNRDRMSIRATLSGGRVVDFRGGRPGQTNVSSSFGQGKNDGNSNNSSQGGGNGGGGAGAVAAVGGDKIDRNGGGGGGGGGFNVPDLKN
ncbi:MAG: hypothetical protein WBA25_07150 [Jannaschia sp.]